MKETLVGEKRLPQYKLRACRKCGGDLYLNRDFYPEYHCLQCGYIVYLKLEIKGEEKGEKNDNKNNGN